MTTKARRIAICLLIVGLLGLAPCVSFAIDDAGAEKTFQDFQKTWLKKLVQLGRYGPKYVKVEKDKQNQGLFLASYREIGKPLSSRIKKTGKKGCPYVGVFSYEELVYARRGKTEKEASKGPFEYLKTVKITEIFRYGNGKWIY